MTLDSLLRELVHTSIALGLRGDQLLVRGCRIDRMGLRPHLIEHKAALAGLLARGRYEAARQEAEDIEHWMSEPWDAPGWLNVDHLLAAFDRPLHPIRIQRLPTRRAQRTTSSQYPESPH